MSHKHGTYLGGVRTVECLRQRSYIDEHTGCWRWRLSLTKGVAFIHFVAPDTGKRIKARGRRVALYLATGKDLPKGQFAFARMCCEHDDCVNPDHVRSGNKRAFVQWMSSTGRIGGGRSAEASRAIWDKRGRKLTPEMVADIRSTDENTHAVAKRLGVSQCAVWQCRKGKTHKHVPIGERAASVFTWRPA